MKIVNKLILLIFLLLIFFGCSYKISPFPKRLSTEIYKGTIWWKINYLTNNKTYSLSGYGDFQIGKKFLYLKLKSPINTTLGYVKWSFPFFEKIEIYNFLDKRCYLILFRETTELKNIPFYFLGLKEKKKNWQFLKYEFINEKNKGIIIGKSFSLEWKIKKIAIAKNHEPLIKELSTLNKFRKIEIIF